MKTHRHPSPHATQTLSPADLLHLHDLPAVDMADLRRWYDRHQKRAAVRRRVVASCLLLLVTFGTHKAFSSNPLPCVSVTTTSQHSDQTICDTILQILCQS